MANRRTLEEQIEQAKLELKQKEAKIKDLMQRQRSKADKARTHRLCKRGGLAESLLPALVKLTDEQFDEWARKVLMSDLSLKFINEMSLSESPNAEDGELPAEEKIKAEPETSETPADEETIAEPEEPEVTPAPPVPEPANAPNYERTNNNPLHNNNANRNGNAFSPKPYNQHHNNRHGNSNSRNHNINRSH